MAQEGGEIGEGARDDDIVVARIPEITHREVVERRSADISAGREAVESVGPGGIHNAVQAAQDAQGLDEG